MANEIGKAIIKTIAYSDIFDFPLTKKELWKYLIIDHKITKESFDRAVLNLGTSVLFKNNYCFFPDRKDLVNLRLKRKNESKKKLKIAEKISSFLAVIPTILFIGVSGNLSIMNADEKDDIDLFIVTRKDTLWTTRLIILLLLRLKGQIRKRGDKEVSNKICLNMMLDETALNFSKERQDLYHAHEIIQMRPLFERDNFYQKLIETNVWTRKFLPNVLNRGNALNRTPQAFFNVALCLALSCSVFEYLSKKTQLHYMKKHITTEVISNHLLAFHPFNYKNFTLREYKKRLKMRLKKRLLY